MLLNRPWFRNGLCSAPVPRFNGPELFSSWRVGPACRDLPSTHSQTASVASRAGAVSLGTPRIGTPRLCAAYPLRQAMEAPMPHWRKSTSPRPVRFNSYVVVWAAIGASLLVGALVLIARHVYV